MVIKNRQYSTVRKKLEHINKTRAQDREMLSALRSRFFCMRQAKLSTLFNPAASVAFLQSSCALDSQQIRHRSNRSRRGLYDGKDIRSGNNVSFSMKATKRTFKPNSFKKRVYSEILDAMIPFHLTASTLRSIDKAGGLDNYLLNHKSITEGEGFEIRKKIRNRLKNQERWERKVAASMTVAE